MTLTLRESLAASPLPRLEAHLLWQRVLGVTRAWLIAHDADPLDPARVAAYRALEARRAAGEPIAYILGHREFFGRDFQVTPAVLIPRPDTELLVECGLRAIRDVREPHVLDLGTGSGIVAVTLALERPDARVRATDLSAEALDVARKNARDLGAKLLFSHGNWYDTELGSARFDLIVSNPPYIPEGDIPGLEPEVRDYDPQLALDGGADGLDVYREIAKVVRNPLRPMRLVLEVGAGQASDVTDIFSAAGWRPLGRQKDLGGHDRAVAMEIHP